jgi:predicted nucleic acid-binding protein
MNSMTAAPNIHPKLTPSRQFVDTNVLIYAHDSTAGSKQAHAKNLLQELWKGGNGCISMQILQGFYYNVTQKIAMPMSKPEAAENIRLLSQWKVHSPHPRDILNAIQIQQHYQLSFWDALVINSAARLGCQIIWSEDLNAGQVYEGVTVQNPFAST